MGGRGVLKFEIFEVKYEAKPEFCKGWEGYDWSTSMGQHNLPLLSS